MKTALTTLLTIFAFGMTACSSKISELVPVTEEQLAAEALKRQSNLELVDNAALAVAPTCTPKATVKMVLTQNTERKIFCRDKTAKAASLAVGRICPGGVEVRAFSASADWKPCEQMTLCGKGPSKSTPLTEAGTVDVLQLQFDDLPWGCVGKIETAFEDALEDATAVRGIEIAVTPPPCPHCSATNTATCEICGTDVTPPQILEVITDISVCNKVSTLVFAEDDGAGLHAQAFSFDGGSTWQESSSKVFAGLELNLAANMIAVRDRAGNIARYAHALKRRSDCDCRHAELIVPHGTKKTVYEKDSVSCGQSCKAGEVSCNLGVLSGDTGLKNAACSAPLCKCTTPDGGLLDLNETRDLYKVNSISCDQTISCDHASNRIKVKCVDVVANKVDVIENTGPIADFKYGACNMKQCSCVHLGVQFKPSDGPLKVYTKDKPVSPESCSTASLVGQVTCTETAGTFKVSGNTDKNIYKFTHCEDNATAEGTGISIHDIGIGEGGGSGGGLGNDVGDGEGFRRRSRGGPGGGSGCDVSKPPYFCGGAGVDVVAGISFCYLPTKNGYPAASFYQSALKQRISPGGFVTAFSRKTVACGDSCSKYMGVIRCDLGVMSDKTKYRYTDCVETCP